MVDGVRLVGVDDMKRAFQSHFQSMFVRKPGINVNMLDLGFTCLFDGECDILDGIFKETEVREAVWECGSGKSPRPDGVSFQFVKQFWGMLKVDFLKFLHEFHE
jgi:hypothetical protein